MTDSKMLELVGDLATAPDTESFLFIAQHSSGDVFSMPAIQDKSGDQEAQLLAEYISVMSSRTGRTRERILKDIVTELNEIKSGEQEMQHV